ncbi:hypothetical protein PV327_002377 [Microctonus hyperodae]|uniref:Galactosylgalactosylxylosylprotein 3-beta-glucuronosyltransferase n=1 Tax=Microctonus hyperodae TaxID=165561 RepID=A0AA39KP96_MICHY|nr:hypothetical protein PV327_002377 [Microctonus hyperodae]
MKSSTKIWMIALAGICLFVYQYHLSTGVRFDQLAAQLNNVDAGAASYSSSNTIDGYDDNAFYKITEVKIRAAVQSVQISNGLSPEIANQLIQELLGQLIKSGLTTKIKSTESIIGTRHSPTASSTTITKSSMTIAIQNTTASELTSAVPTKKITRTPLPLYIITPTYRRPEQIPELTRMAHTLMLVENVHWLVIEDAKIATEAVTKLLNRTGLRFDHLTAPMPDKYKQKKGAKPRGVSNRNRGLKWIRANATDGVFYFADDDNTYDLDLFNEIRKTNKVSMLPVGLCTKFGLSSPIVKDGKFIGFYDGWIAGRKFPVDMASFAVNVKFLLQRPNATMPYRAGFEEDGFLRSLAPFEPREIELLANNCTRVLAWHTQTKKNEPSAPLDMKLYYSTNLVDLKKQIV